MTLKKADFVVENFTVFVAKNDSLFCIWLS